MTSVGYPSFICWISNGSTAGTHGMWDEVYSFACSATAP